MHEVLPYQTGCTYNQRAHKTIIWFDGGRCASDSTRTARVAMQATITTGEDMGSYVPTRGQSGNILTLSIVLAIGNSPSVAFGNQCNDEVELAERQGVLRLTDTAEGDLAELGGQAKGEAEFASVYFHQDALLKSLSMVHLTGKGMNHRSARNLRAGIVKSDFGKLGAYKSWWVSKEGDGRAMIEALQLKGASPLSSLLRELNNGKPFINPSLSLETVNEVFKVAFFAVGYFHEFPGMRVVEKEFQAQQISKADFREQIEAIYAHNGPGDPAFNHEGAQPFWAGVPAGIRNQIEAAIKVGKLPPEAAEFFTGTIFEQADGSLRYPDPVSGPAARHMIEDRFDGYRDSRKIRNEVFFMPPIQAEIDMMFGTNYRGTRAALVYDRDVLLPRLHQQGKISAAERSDLQSMASQRLQRLEAIQQNYARLVENGTSLAGTNPESITFIVQRNPGGAPERVTFTANEIGAGNSEAAVRFRQFVDEYVRRPIMELDSSMSI